MNKSVFGSFSYLRTSLQLSSEVPLLEVTPHLEASVKLDLVLPSRSSSLVVQFVDTLLYSWHHQSLGGRAVAVVFRRKRKQANQPRTLTMLGMHSCGTSVPSVQRLFPAMKVFKNLISLIICMGI